MRFCPLLLLLCLSCSKKPNFDLTGKCIPFQSIEIKAEIDGTLTNVYFEDGNSVCEGDILFTIDSKFYEAKLDEVRAKRLQTFTELQRMAETVDRYQTLLTNKYISETDCRQLILEMNQLEASVMELDAEIRLAELALDHCSIKAPFQGVIEKRFLSKGSLVQKGEIIAILNQIDPIYIDLTLTETETLRLEVLNNDHTLSPGQIIKARIIP